MKACYVCKATLPLSEFYKNRSKPDGYSPGCRECSKKVAKDHRAKKHTDPAYAEYMRWYFMRVNYGISREQYGQLLADQNGLCRLCGTEGEYVKRPGKTVAGLDAFGLCVDHDHATGVIRGLLCNNCNRALGLLKDDQLLLSKALTYVTTSGAAMRPAHIPTRAKNVPITSAPVAPVLECHESQKKTSEESTSGLQTL